MTALSISLNEEEKNLISRYAKSNNKSISQVVKNAILEKIEDELDLEIINDYLERKKNGTLELVSYEDAMKELGL